MQLSRAQTGLEMATEPSKHMSKGNARKGQLSLLFTQQ